MAKQDFYKILGISRDADEKAVKKAYRKLARTCHPDVNPNDPKAAERFKQISEAYEVLSDPEKRKLYDQFGHTAFQQGFDPRAGPGGPGRGPFEGFDFGNIHFDFGGGGAPGGIPFGNAGNIFEQFFQRQQARPQGSEKGQDLSVTLELGFLDAMNGLETMVSVPRRDERGLFTTERVKVKIPPGVDTGSRIRVAGKGEPGINGGPPGDLYIQTKVQPHPQFERKGANLHLEIPVTITEAGLGAKIPVPSLSGSVLLKIPPGTGSGQTFRLTGKGAPHLKGHGFGDLYVKVKIVVPKHLSMRSREILEEFGKLNPENPREELGGVA